MTDLTRLEWGWILSYRYNLDFHMPSVWHLDLVVGYAEMQPQIWQIKSHNNTWLWHREDFHTEEKNSQFISEISHFDTSIRNSTPRFLVTVLFHRVRALYYRGSTIHNKKIPVTILNNLNNLRTYATITGKSYISGR